MSLAGADGAQAAKLLRASVKHGAATLGTITEAAVKRLLGKPDNISKSNALFTDDERQQLADTLAATNATAELLGRARIRKRLEQAEKHAENYEEFAESAATDFSCFDDKPVKPLEPNRALEWFRSLFPGLKPPKDFAKQQERRAFTLAETTEKILLQSVHEAIARVLETGEKVRETPKLIDIILDDAGVSPSNPQYAEMIVRTNMMGAYNEGSQEELHEVADDFPVWKYLGIRDGRQGKDHEPHFDKYYPNSVNFADVRGDRPYNCRCTFTPVYKSAWKRLQAGGVQVSRFAERRPFARFAETCDLPDGILEIPDIRQPDSSSCGAAASMAVAGFYGVGPKSIDEWKRLLGTDPDAGTPPEHIVRVLTSLGLDAEPRQLMTLRDLRECWKQGWPVIAPIQDYSPDAGGGDYDDGHYVVVVGVALGYVFVQDSMADVELEDANSAAAPGKVMIRQRQFMDAWHDRGADGRYYLRFGIVVR